MSNSAADRDPDSALDARQERAAVLLAAGSTHRTAAAELGVNEKTIQRWCHESAFASFVSQLRDEALSTAVGRLSIVSGDAVIVLGKLLDSPEETIRLRAALGALDVALRYRDQGELVKRMAELERKVTEARS